MPTDMPTDPYAVLRALLRAEAVRSASRPQRAEAKPQPAEQDRRG
ncbi:hypothetical protein ACH4ZX_31675 [Streptomyces sp. NPDC020490]